MMRKRAVVSWSGGKDSSLALQSVLDEGELEVVSLLTTVTMTYQRISMHGVRTELLRAQQRSLDLPLFEIGIPPNCSDAAYERALHELLRDLQADGVRDVVFGDLFLQDIRAYRQTQLAKVGMNCQFPLWGRHTGRLAQEFIDRGFKAIIVCVDPKQLDSEFCGRDFDGALLSELPTSCDPCGERGEFHTFVHDGPIFRQPITVSRGEIVGRQDFVFCDLILDSAAGIATG